MIVSSILQGGLATTNEMCLTFLLYYPAIPLTACVSVPTYNKFVDVMDPRTANSTLKWADPQKLNATLTPMNWADPEVRNDFKRKVAESTWVYFCSSETLTPKVCVVDQ
jgi:hypothetical protein